MTSGRVKYLFFQILFPAVFLLFFAGITVAGYLHYISEKKNLNIKIEDNLGSIATLKIAELSTWRQERMGDATFVSTTPLYVRFLTDINAGRQSPDEEAVLRRMEDLRKSYGYKGIILFDAKGNQVAAVPKDETITSIGRAFVTRVLSENKLLLTDIHLYGGVSYPHIDVLAPVSPVPGEAPRGVLFLRTDMESFLYPLIQKWPMRDNTGETLLVRRDGEEVVYLNDLKFNEDAALKLRFPVDRADLPAAMAVKGRMGFMEGTDYRGRKVFAFAEHVPDSNWYLIAKVDQSEAQEPLKREFRRVAIVIVSLMLSVFLLLLTIWQGQHLEMVRIEYEDKARTLVLEKHYDFLAKYANDIIILADKDWRIVQFNDRAMEAYGYSREEMTGMDGEKFRPVSERADIPAMMTKLEKDGSAIWETIHIRKDGTVFPVEISGRFMAVEGEKYYQFIIRDITERKRAEESLRHSDALIRTVFAAAPGGIGFAKDRVVNFVNDRFGDLTGYSPQEISGKNSRILYESDDEYERIGRQLYGALGQKKVEAAETKWRRRDGSVRDIYLSVAAITRNLSEGVVFTALDITDRKKAEAEMRKARDDWRITFNAAGDSIMLLDRECRVVRANQAACEFFGKTEMDVIGGVYHDLFHGVGMPEGVCPVEKARKTRCRDEVEAALPYGKRWVLISADPIVDDRGEISGFVHIVRDITERKHSENALRESEMRFRTIFDKNPIGVVTTAPDLSFIQANPAFCRMTGYTEEELRSLTFKDITHPEHVGKDVDHVKRLFSGELPVYRTEKRYIRKDKGVLWAQTTVTPVRDEKGQVVYVLAMIEDITERKKAELAIKDMSAMLSEAQKIAHIGSWEYHADTGKTVWSEEEFRIFGLEPASHSPSYEEHLKMIHPDDVEMLRTMFDRALHDGAVFDLENRVVRPDGSVRYVRNLARPYFDGAGKLVKYGGTTQDITEWKETREKIEIFERFARSASQGFGMATMEGKITYLSPAVCVIFDEAGQEDAIGKRIFDYYPPERREYIKNEILPIVIRDGHWVGESEIASAKGRRIPVLENIFIIRDDKGNPQYYANVITDITERKKAEKELNAYKDHLEEMVKERTAELESFSYSVSHDLRAPIRAIDGFTRILGEEFGSKLDQEGKRILGVIVKSTKSMGQLIDDLLAFSRLGRREAQFDSIDMEFLARETAEGLIREAEGRKVDLKIGCLPKAFGDRAMMQIALVNLFSNALKFTRKNENARIEVGSFDSADETVYFVRDNGVGFDMKYGPKLFGVFQRLHSQEEFEGTGIGLALVKRIISKHGGRIWAEGEVGKGATFYFSLPKRKSTEIRGQRTDGEK